MCLGGSAAPTYRPPPPRVIPPGPESPNDKVNNVEVENINPRSQQKAKRQANRGTTASKQTAKTDKAY
jgi:hypothetical protein